MNKKSQTKLIVLIISIFLIFSIGVYAYSNTLSISPIPGNEWTTGDNLYANITPNYDYINNPCWQRGNDTSYNMTVSYTWGFGNESGEFFENHTAIEVPIANGTVVQFNASDIGEEGKFSWYVTAYNYSEGLYENCSDIVVTSPTYNLWIDSTAPAITLDRPLASTTSTDSEVYFNATVVDNNPNYCHLYINGTSSEPSLNWSWNYLNDTVFDATIAYPDGNYSWFINCEDKAGSNTQSANRTFMVDTTAPTLTEITTNNSWSTTTTTLLKFDVTDTNLNTCDLYGNFTNAGSQTLIFNQTNTTMVSGEDVTFNLNLPDTTYPTPYYYNVTCNDTLGNRVWLSERAINIDSTIPGSIYTLSLNGRVSTDHTPMINFTLPGESNFRAYILNFYTTSGDWVAQTNSTSNNTDYIVLDSYLDSDTNYTYNITIIDWAGNINTTESNNITWAYKTDSTCYNNYPGYNFCGMIRDGFHNLSTIATEANADYVYVWNGTWVSHTAGSSTNADYQLQRGEVAVVHIDEDGPYEWEDRVWSFNTTMNGSPLGSLNMTNSTGSPYSLISIAQNTTGVNFTELEASFTASVQGWVGGNSIQYLTLINNSVLGDSNNDQQYISYRFGKGYNEGVTSEFATALWAHNTNASNVLAINTQWSRSVGGAG